MTEIRICVPVYGQKFEQMYELSKKVAKRFVPDAKVFAHSYNPVAFPIQYTYPAHAGDYAKAEATSLYTKEGPVFIMDADAVLVRSPKWKFENEKAVLSITAREGYPLELPRDEPCRIIRNAAEYAGLLEPGGTADVNPQFFWATENLLPLFQEMDSIFCQHMREQGLGIEYMRSLAVWTMVWLKLKKEGKTEMFPKMYNWRLPHPVFHCYMIHEDRLSDYQIFVDYIMNQPLDSPNLPPGSLFGV